MKRIIVLSVALSVSAGLFGASPVLTGDVFAINGRIVFPVGGEASDYAVQCRPTDDDGWTDVPGFLSENALVFSVGQVASGKAQWRIGWSSGDEWTAPQTVDARFPLAGTALCASKYGDANAAAAAFDGNVNSYYEPGDNAKKWVGIDFGKEQTVVGFAYVPRMGWGSGGNNRVKGVQIQTADDAEFTSNVETVFTIGDEDVPFAVNRVTFEEPVVARYMRAYVPDWGVWMNIAELEFDSDAEDVPDESADLSEVGLESTNAGAGDYRPKLMWNAVNAPVTVQCAADPNGPWSDLSPLSARTAAFVDDSAPIGIVRHYRLVSGAFVSATVSYRRLRRIDISGCTIAWQGEAIWDAGATGDKAFDGDTGTSPDLAYDLNGDNGLMKLGVDFGADGASNHVAVVGLFPRLWNHERLRGAALYGTGNALAPELATDDFARRLSDVVTGFPGDNVWTTLACDPTFAYRTYYLHGGRHSNYAEVAFYGWYDGDVQGQAEPLPTELTTFTAVYNTVEEFAAQLWWNPVAGDVRVERAPSRSGPWSAVATVPGANATVIDRNIKLGVRWFYRFVAGGRTGEPVPFRKMRRLYPEFGTTFGTGHPYEGNPAADYPTVFDGQTDVFCDLFPDGGAPDSSIKLGVDFGAATNVVGMIRVYPRNDNLRARMNGLTLFGSAADAETESKDSGRVEGTVALTAPLVNVDRTDWQNVFIAELDRGHPPAFRTYYVSDMQEAGGNVAELEFYGWGVDEIHPGFFVTLR